MSIIPPRCDVSHDLFYSHCRLPGRRLVPAAEFNAALAQLPPVDAEQWRRDLAEADDIFGDDLPADPWDGPGTR
jgi:hypothetical protein